MSCLCCRRETGLSTPTSPPAAAAAAAIPAGVCTSSAAECPGRPACLSVRGRGEGREKRESKGGGERRRGKGGEKKEKRERERENEEDGGPLPADAVELMPCSIHCVMAASSWSSQSRHSCHWWTHPLQMMREEGTSRGSS